MSAAMADLPLPHRKRHRRVGPAAGLTGVVVALIGAAAIVFRDKLASIRGK